MECHSISVLIPAYNAENTIVDALNSVISQKYKGVIKIIVIDDGSTDSTVQVINSFISTNKISNIYILKKENGGVSSARNYGLKNVNTEYIAFLDADDIWLPGKLDAQMECFTKDKKILFLGTSRNNETYRYITSIHNGVYEIRVRQMLLSWWPSVPTVIFKKTVLDKVGCFDESIRFGEDGDYWLRVLKFFPIHVLNESFVTTGGGKFNYGASGLSANLKKMQQGEQLALRNSLYRRQISIIEFYFYWLLMRAKYIRRVLVVYFRR